MAGAAGGADLLCSGHGRLRAFWQFGTLESGALTPKWVGDSQFVLQVLTGSVVQAVLVMTISAGGCNGSYAHPGDGLWSSTWKQQSQ